MLKAAAASDGWLARAVRAPGLALQYLTTREPDVDMLEVALAAFQLAMDPPEQDLIAAEQPEVRTQETDLQKAQPAASDEAAEGADGQA